MTGTSNAKRPLPRKMWPPCLAIKLLQLLARHPHGQNVAMRLSGSPGGAALLHLAVLLRSRRNLRWHLGHILRNLRPGRGPGCAAQGPPSSSKSV